MQESINDLLKDPEHKKALEAEKLQAEELEQIRIQRPKTSSSENQSKPPQAEETSRTEKESKTGGRKTKYEIGNELRKATGSFLNAKTRAEITKIGAKQVPDFKKRKLIQDMGLNKFQERKVLGALGIKQRGRGRFFG